MSVRRMPLLLRLTASSVAKLANRLGLYHIKSEQENLSFRYRCSREYAEIEAQLAEEQKPSMADIDAFVGAIMRSVIA